MNGYPDMASGHDSFRRSGGPQFSGARTGVWDCAHRCVVVFRVALWKRFLSPGVRGDPGTKLSNRVVRPWMREPPIKCGVMDAVAASGEATIACLTAAYPDYLSCAVQNGSAA